MMLPAKGYTDFETKLGTSLFSELRDAEKLRSCFPILGRHPTFPIIIYKSFYSSYPWRKLL